MCACAGARVCVCVCVRVCVGVCVSGCVGVSAYVVHLRLNVCVYVRPLVPV